MLQSIRLQNFQCHKDTTVHFDESITVISGDNDSGKTAILRALQWVCFNRPSGDGFIRHGAGTCRVTIRIDGRTVDRIRGKNRNCYRLDGKVFNALGVGKVPPEIVALLNVSPLNVQEQLAPPFWFLQSAGEVSRELNQIVALDAIDRTLAHIASDLREAKSETRFVGERVAGLRKELKKSSWIPKAITEFETIERIQTGIESLDSNVSGLQKLIRDGESIKLDGDLAAESILAMGNAIRIGQEAEELGRKAEILLLILEDIDGAEQEQWQLANDLKKVEKELRKQLGNQCPLCGTRTTR